jgi:hypothetical protein
MNPRVKNSIPLTFVLSPEAVERKSPGRARAWSCNLLSMNRGFAERHPKRSWFVVERFSADLRAWRNGTTTALKRSTTNLTCGRFRVPVRAKRSGGYP